MVRESKKKPSTKSNKETERYSFVSYSSSSVITPHQSIKQELVYENNSGKIKGKFIEEKNGKKIVDKQFKSQKGFDALRKRLAQH